MEEKLTPALNLKPDGKTELSADEFQRELYSWFEDRGLLSELRAHLRMQMINILKSSTAVKSSTKQGFSPKIQALNMLIAEFLLHQSYHYTLCVFTTEVPLINIFPDISNCPLSNKPAKIDENKSKWRFAAKDMWDLLETLGITKNSEEGKEVATMYCQNFDETLLTCLIRILYNMKMKRVPSGVTKVKIDNTKYMKDSKQTYPTVVLESITDLLSNFEISPEYIEQIMELIKFIIAEERKALQNIYKSEYIKYKEQLEKIVSTKLEESRKKEEYIETIFTNQKLILEKKLMKTQAHLANCSGSLQKQFEEYQEKSELLKSKESELQEKEKLINTMKNNLQMELEKLYVEKLKIEESRKKIESNVELTSNVHTNKKTTMDSVKELEHSTDKGEQTLNNNIVVENALLKQTIKQLHAENANLKNQNSDCQSRVRELAEHAKKIRSDLQTYESKYGLGFTRRTRKSEVSAIPIPSMPTLSPRGINKNLPNAGNGEAVSSYPASPSSYAAQFRDMKRKPIHRRFNNSSTTSDDPSYTEEILQETKQRLRDLERESEKIDQNFKEYYRKKPMNLIYDKEIHGERNNPENNFRTTISPSTGFGFCDVPSTSAANVFQFPITVLPTNKSTTDVTAKKYAKNLSENRLYFQSNNNLTKEHIMSINEDTNVENQHKNNKSSGQSANSSGLLDVNVPAVSFSTIDVSSDKSNTSTESGRIGR